MKKEVALPVLLILTIAIFVSGCAEKTSESKGDKNAPADIANPASVYCEQQGGKLEIRATKSGEVGYCKFVNGDECEEWAYYRGDCQKSSAPEKNDSISETEVKTQDSVKVVKIPSAIVNNCVGFLPGASDEMATISLAGGAWARPHPGPFAWQWIEPIKGSFGFRETDRFVLEAQKNNVAILATVWPYANWDQSNCHSNECLVTVEDQFYPKIKVGFDEKVVNDGIPPSRCSPCNFDDYKVFLSKLVERYDGDGKDDMPSLQIPIKYWEILNEPEMKEPFLTFYKGDEVGYIEILKSSNEAIKSTCPDCKIVQGGAAGISSDMLDYWRSIFDLGGADYFDIANIHYINSGDISTLNVKDFKALMQEKNIDKPVWVTEAEYGSETEVAGSFEGALNAGASKIFFTRFVAGQKGPPKLGVYSKAYSEAAQKCQ